MIINDYKLLDQLWMENDELAEYDELDLSNTKKYLKNGAIITYKVNDYLFKELPLIINYINSKGYEIVYLNTLLEE